MSMEIIRQFEKEDANEVESLFRFLSTRPDARFYLENVEKDKNCHCVVIEEEGKILGFGALVVYCVPSKGLVARIEDVVVDESCQGRGLGRKLMEFLIDIAKKEHICEIDLTSKRIRTTARKFYESLGFKMRESDIFRLHI